MLLVNSLYGAYSNLGEEEYSCLRPGEHFFNINYDKELNRISFKKMQFAVLYIYIYTAGICSTCCVIFTQHSMCCAQHVLHAAHSVLRAAIAASGFRAVFLTQHAVPIDLIMRF